MRLWRDDAGVTRCWWCAGDDDYVAYHDTDWGRPVTDDTRLFEKLCLEGFQAGLSWLTILRKREAFRAAFAGFDPTAVADFGVADIERLLSDASIVRHRGKITATIANAQAMLKLWEDGETLFALASRHVPGRPAGLDPRAPMPTATAESIALSKELKGRGFAFVGPTTGYAFMQAMGLVNDHVRGCDLLGSGRG